jgi:hypothetical protein
MKSPSASQKKLQLSPSLFVLGVAVVLMLLSILLFGCNKSTPTEPIQTFYELDVIYDGNERVELDETIVFQNTTGTLLTSVAFRLYPNAFKKDASASPFGEDAVNDYHSQGNFGGIEISSVKINRLNVDFVICGTDGTVLEIPTCLNPWDTCVISLSCVIDLPESKHRLGVSEGTTILTGFYPILCALGGDGWRKDDYHCFGDPFVHQTATYSVNLTCPIDYVVAGSGQSNTSVENVALDFDTNVSTTTESAKTMEFYAENIRDFALFLSKDFAVTSATASVGDGVQVDYFYLKDTCPSQTLSLAVDALERFSVAFGDYPHSTYTLVNCDFVGGGMEYGALSLISSLDAEVIIHETAHQWWYGIVGNDQINHSWLDEGLAEFSTHYYHLLKGDRATYDKKLRLLKSEYAKWSTLSSVGFDGVMNKALYDFLTEGEYVATAYVKGAILFDTLQDIMGDDAFLSALRDYISNNRFAIADQDALTTSFEGRHRGIGKIISSFVEGKDK